jgi:undecaprenyl-diphosphatase
VIAASLDDRLAVWIATHRYRPLDQPFIWLGTAEKLGLLWIVLALLLGLLLRRGLAWSVGLALATGLTTFAADSVSFALKDLTHRRRPFADHAQIHPLYAVHSSSLPAGHAATAFAGATVLSFIAPRAAPAFVLLAAAVGFSRVYVGVHYPTDVLAGAAIGIVVALTAVAVGKALRSRLRPATPARRRRGKRPPT